MLGPAVCDVVPYASDGTCNSAANPWPKNYTPPDPHFYPDIGDNQYRRLAESSGNVSFFNPEKLCTQFKWERWNPHGCGVLS